MSFKEEVIDLIERCNKNIIIHPHAAEQAVARNINIEIVKDKIIKNDFIDAVPNFNERKQYKADNSFIIKIRQSKTYNIEAVTYFYLRNKVLITTVYKSV